MLTETLSATEQSISIWSVVSKTTLEPDKTSKEPPTGMGASFTKKVVVFVAVLPPPLVSDTSLTEAVTCDVWTFAKTSPIITVVVLEGTVYKSSGVPELAGITSCETTLNVFAILFSYYPNAIAIATPPSPVSGTFVNCDPSTPGKRELPSS